MTFWRAVSHNTGFERGGNAKRGYSAANDLIGIAGVTGSRTQGSAKEIGPRGHGMSTAFGEGGEQRVQAVVSLSDYAIEQRVGRL